MKTALTVNRLPKIYLYFLSALLISFLGFSCSDQEAETADLNSDLPSIVEVLESFNKGQSSTAKMLNNKEGDYTPTFDVLSKALARTKLASTVSRNRLTVFAPTDMAFAALGITTENVTEVENLADILLYHAVGMTVYSNQLENGPVTTVNGANVIVNIDNGVLINNAKVTMADIKARNGVVHVIDSVLFPPNLTIAGIAGSSDDFSILFDAVVKANLGGILTDGGPFTVFAPTNKAFMDLLEATPYNSLDDIPMDVLTQILLYHVVDGYVFSNQLMNGFVPTLNGAAVYVNLDMAPMVYINDSKVKISNVQATNGVIHAIDKVLMPPTMNLVETAASFDPEFSLLLTAANAAGLGDTLSNGGPFTVFAPTNQAFLNFLNLSDLEEAKGVIQGLDTTVLTNILLYHVVEGRVYSSDLSSGSVTTLNGNFDLDLSSLTIDGNAMLIPELLNVQATNGVIHVVDAVLMP
ncbi:fasciclin domain-containing protein [Tamlana fucoidanivorans]|nr:fasciclin domain-containing protein [Tamlana fucoidanivorans]